MLTDRVGGCLGEWGPNGFLTNVPQTWDLAVDLGLADRLLPADDSAEQRYLWVNGALRALPMKPPAFFTSDILSVKGRLRVLLEPFQGKGPEDDETVFSFASRRIGREAASVLVDAMVSGIYAGDPANLSLKAAFPRMRNMERQYGSLVKALIAIKREARRKKTKGGGPMGPGGRLTSFDEGMEVLIRTLADGLGSRLRTGVSVTGLAPARGRLSPDAGGPRRARGALRASGGAGHPVLRVPCHPQGELSQGGLAAGRDSLRGDHRGLHGLRARTGQPLPGGVRVHRAAGAGAAASGLHLGGEHLSRPCLAKPRAPARPWWAGPATPEAALLSEGRTVDLVHGELDRMLGGINGRPVEVGLFRHAKGIPQYVPGHPERLDAIDRDLAGHPGLYLAGNAYRGIGVNDCVREAQALGGPVGRGRATPCPRAAAPEEVRR